MTWQDIDFERKEFHFTKETTQINGKPVTDIPKSLRSIRTVSTSDLIIDMLRSWKEEQRNFMIKVGTQRHGYRGNDFDKNYIFIQTKSPGLQMYPSTPYAKFKKIIRRYNATCTDEKDKLPEIVLHDLRHTNATLQIAAGTDTPTLSARLGHSNVSTTLNIYAHPLKTKDRKAVDELQSLIYG